jgi:phosphoadenosine phosphosulfate reductase
LLSRHAAAQAEEWARELEGRTAAEIVAWSVDRFGDGLVIGSSFGKDSVVVMDMARRMRPDIPVLFLETGYHFTETLEFRDRLRNESHVNIVDVRPDLSVPQQDAAYGVELFARAPDQCCQMRKVAPLRRALTGRQAWLTGLRRSQHPQRAGTPVVEWQEFSEDGSGVYKINPLAAWPLSEVESYLDQHHLPRHPLWAKGYPSIGCAPCTAPVAAGESERAGRWKGQGKIECGIHVVGVRRDAGAVTAATSPERA